MQSSQTPSLISLPFANAGNKNNIPNPSQSSSNPGKASFNDGFPSVTMLPIEAGGIPPSGADMNGILNIMTALQRYQCAGGLIRFDSTFASAVGGYPKGAILASTNGVTVWQSNVENNTTDPDSSSASGWGNLLAGGPSSASLTQQGYMKFASGLIFQWVAAIANGRTKITLPLTFPNLLLSAVGMVSGGATWLVSNDNASITVDHNSSTPTPGLLLWVIGY